MRSPAYLEVRDLLSSAKTLDDLRVISIALGTLSLSQSLTFKETKKLVKRLYKIADKIKQSPPKDRK